MRVIAEQSKGWVIDTGDGIFLGKYWWFCHKPPVIPASLDGYITAVFRTRKIARDALINVKGSYPKATVRRATIDISIER